ncbi:hypothetical protein BN12_130063 [Nostocoides japonicum T1-X7]|uniref:DUF3806 domain-containing protein n=1 Tax=Nostocoides japonicum T1-X7 TaxID=1194083 RepID=A0A077LWZ3_9MICO|nr:DUF3806 domain-containing protein [Tetrasphaera japonica]CCH76524.1 hypothetical protein BN12_130063 [Tetrasphaera japonica T1-X7]
MALFSRRRGGGDRTAAESPSPLTTLAEDTTSSAFAGDVEDDGRPQRPDTAPIGDSERARIDAALQRLEGDGVDVDDLAALGAAYDRARATGADGDVVVETIGLAIGEHLVRHARMDWALVTDVFGTDLGVVARRRGTTLIPTNIVATRWLSGQTGWVPGVVGHLIRLGTG